MLINRKPIICDKCNVEMTLAPYQNPYVTRHGIVFHNIKVDVYVCPQCAREKEVLPNEEDGYSAGAGLFSED